MGPASTMTSPKGRAANHSELGAVERYRVFCQRHNQVFPTPGANASGQLAVEVI